MALEYMGTGTLSDVLTRSDDVDAHTAEKHDCRTDPNRTGVCRLVVLHNSDRIAWVFDPMVAGRGCFLYKIRFCPYCGIEFKVVVV